MPVVQVNLIAGYDEKTRISLADRLTRAVRATIAAPTESITVFLHEVAPASYMRGQRSAAAAASDENKPKQADAAIKPGAPVPDAQACVRAFLDAMGARDLAAARQWLAPDFTMEFPGPVRFQQLEELFEWSRPRYSEIIKTYERFESAWQMDTTTVWCHGTLNGKWPDGRPFQGIRFVDRFTVRHGQLIDQTVWNDLAEHRPA
ncbi:MAG: tautomerase family protein [Burkholderiaceae bacterium]